MQNFLTTAAIASVIFIIGYVSYLWIGKDNPVEEECENVIEDVTGKRIDISGPDSK